MRPKTSDELKRAITLRAAGWTLSAIVTETGISASTLQRYFRTHGIERGTISTEAVEQAKQRLLSDAGFIDDLKHQIAASIIDDLSLVRQLRETLALSLEELAADPTTPATLKARSLAALSTSLKITQDVSRRALRIDNNDSLNGIQEPTRLIIEKMTDEEMQAAQDRFKEDEDVDETELLNDDLVSMED
ncbi:helix-turn-helix domain-containing protein [Methylomicrobium agile]|uniref:helix-turn-helix domain-containing protein n=1 Tax=Methylomicrobium agile TaxID=39774 RepID=UPI0004DF5103|nr:helix-turn-helix domain-containing protein [Methylomicrobium agile]